MDYLGKEKKIIICFVVAFLLHLFFFFPSPETFISFEPSASITPFEYLKKSKTSGTIKKTSSSREEVKNTEDNQNEGEAIEAQVQGEISPSYPEFSRKKGEEGECVLLVFLSEKGDILKVELEKSSGYSRLDESAIAHLSQKKFIPATKGGVSVSSTKRIHIHFSLKK